MQVRNKNKNNFLCLENIPEITPINIYQLFKHAFITYAFIYQATSTLTKELQMLKT